MNAGDTKEYNEYIGEDQPSHLVISFSDWSLGNIWGMVALFLLINAVLVWCRYRRSSKRVRFVSDSVSSNKAEV